jgi:serine/threonine protein kinase
LDLDLGLIFLFLFFAAKGKVDMCFMRQILFVLSVCEWIKFAFAAQYVVSNSAATSTCQNFTCPNILTAIQSVATGDEIILEPGVYQGNDNTGLEPTKVYGNSNTGYNFHSVSISGNGDTSSVIVQGGIFNTRFLEIIDGSFSSIKNITFQNFALPTVTSYVLSDLAIQGVNIAGGTFTVTNSTTPVVFENLNFYNNSALFGAGISAVRSSLQISNCEFISNIAGYHGGALSVEQTDILVSNSRFVNNTATSVRQQLAASGGAIFSIGVSTNHTNVVDSIFINNTADHNGGAVSLEPGTNIPQVTSGTVHFKRCRFIGNVATGVGSCLSTTSCITSGGAIYVTSANFSVSDSHFEDNRAYTTSTIDLAEGGAIFSTNLLGSKGTARSMSKISRSVFVKNSAWGYGGAIYFDKQRFQITKSTFESNEVLTSDQLFCDTPAAGGAIYVSYSNSDLNSIVSTNFTGNNAITGWGGAVFATENSALQLSHVIFTNNFAISSYTNAALGGAVMITGQCSLRIEDCDFEQNAAVPLINLSPMTYSGGGGALFAQSSAVTIFRTSFTRNFAFTGQFDGGSTGGGVVLEDCYPAIVEQSRFVQNGAVGFLGKSSYASCGTGGAIYAKFSSANINGTTFLQNWASAGGKQNSIGGGVAIYFDYASVEPVAHGVQLNHSLFQNNTAFGQICSQLQAGSGGAIGVVGANHPPLLINNVTFSQNSALGNPGNKGLSGLTADGGAISAGLNSNVTVASSHFYHNAALYGTGNDFSSIAGEDDEENYLNFEDVVFQTADASALINRGNDLSAVSSKLCAAAQVLIDNMRQKVKTSSPTVGATKKPYVSKYLHHHRGLNDEYTVVEDYGIHVSIPTDPSSKKPSLVHLFDETIEVNSDEILEWKFGNENNSPSIDEEGLIRVVKSYFETEKRTLTADDSTKENREQMNSVSSAAQILSKSLSFLDSRGQSLKNAMKKDNLKWSSKKRRNFKPFLETIENIRGNSFSSANDGRLLSTTDFTLSGAIVDNFVDSLPDVIATRGRTNFVNPTFIGEYHIFVGDYNAFLQARQGLLDSSNDYYKSYMSFVGTINVDNLTLTAINAEVYSDVIDAKDHQNLHLSRLNVFNSSILFTSNVIVKGQSLLLDSLFQGEAGNFVSLPINAKPNITFQSDIITGYSLPEIFGYEESLRPVLHEFKNHRHNFSNQSYASIQRYRGCDIYIEGQMIVDSPYHAVNVYLGSTGLNDKYFNYFSDSQMYFENNATMTIRKSGSLVLLTNTLAQTDNENAVAMFNFGNVALLGTTVSLVYQTQKNPQKLKAIAHSGSLGSKLTVIGNYVQAASGMMTIYLNYSYQVQPVVYLANNRTFSGSVYVNFYGVDPSTKDPDFCPGLQLGSDPSSFTVVSFLKTDSSGLLDVDPKYLATKPAKIDSIQGLQFTAKVENLHIDSLNASVHNQVIEVQNIACENIFAYYAGVNAAAATTGNKYPCYICVQNSSCSLCQDATGTQSCVESSNSCAAPYTQRFTGDCCGECKTGGTCIPTASDFSSFECQYSCSWFYAQKSPGCKEISTTGMVVIFIGCALFIGVLGIYFMYQRSAKQKEQVLEELREGILRHTLTANNDYIQDMQQALILNDVFVKYDELKIESKVGEGSFGVVHKATFRGAQVAVKQMRSMFLEITDKEIEEFRKEAYMMSRLRHPNIVLVMGITLVDMEPVQPKSRTLNSVMDSEIPGNNDKDKDKKKPPKPQKTVCIITEFLEQGSLSDILYGSTRLPPEIFTYELILTIALQAARGMLYLHSHQPPICHRDLKSSNLVVDDHWVVKVTDFGMSRIVPEKVQDEDKGVGEDDRESLGGGSIAEISEMNAGSIMVTGSVASRSSANTNGMQTLQTGQTHMTGAPNLEMTSNLGTTAWCAPEVLTSSSRARYSIKVDVYSYGMVLWELYEKKRPFEEYSSRFDIMDAVKAGKRPTISENCPPTYKALIKRCWQTEPSRRPTFNYIVRYLKDELARVKRSKAVNQSSGGFGGQFSNFPRPGSVSALIRQSFSGNPPGGSNSTENQPRPSMSLLGRFSMSAQNRDSISHQSTTAVLGAIGNPLQSVVHGADLESGDLRAEDVGMSPIASVNNTPMSFLEERRQAELASEKAAAVTVRDPNNTGLGATNPSHRESFRNLPENRTPLVAAVDRSLSYLTESPAISSQPFRPYQKYGAPQQNTWRDKYVMQFSGWNSANPDSGLPPQSRPVAGASPGMSYSPATVPDTVRQGRPLSSPSRQMAPPANYPRGFVPSAGPNAPNRSEPSSQAQSPSNVSPIGTMTSIHNETSNDDHAVFTMDDEQSQSSGS